MNIYLHPALTLLWCAIVLAKLNLFGIQILRPARARHLLFAFFVLFSAVRSAALIALSAMRNGSVYQETMIWTESVILWLIAAIALQCFWSVFFVPVRVMPKELLIQFVGLLIVLSVGLFALSEMRSRGRSELIERRSVHIWLAGVFWLISIYANKLNIPWRPRTYGIGLGFIFSLTASAVISVFLADLPAFFIPYSFAPILLTEAITAGIWTYFFLMPENGSISRPLNTSIHSSTAHSS